MRSSVNVGDIQHPSPKSILFCHRPEVFRENILRVFLFTFWIDAHSDYDKCYPGMMAHIKFGMTFVLVSSEAFEKIIFLKRVPKKLFNTFAEFWKVSISTHLATGHLDDELLYYVDINNENWLEWGLVIRWKAEN